MRRLAELELQEALKIGKKLAKYFVYSCGEGEHYISLTERLRVANTRSALLEAIYTMIRYGKQHLKQGIKDINKQEVDTIFAFIRTGDKKEVSRFYSALNTYISTFEVEHIREQERYLLELLLD